MSLDKTDSGTAEESHANRQAQLRRKVGILYILMMLVPVAALLVMGIAFSDNYNIIGMTELEATQIRSVTTVLTIAVAFFEWSLLKRVKRTQETIEYEDMKFRNPDSSPLDWR